MKECENSVEMNRAKQILSSPNYITVHYNGESVWIDSCHEEDQTASVHLSEGDEEIQKVPVAELEEE